MQDVRWDAPMELVGAMQALADLEGAVRQLYVEAVTVDGMLPDADERCEELEEMVGVAREQLVGLRARRLAEEIGELEAEARSLGADPERWVVDRLEARDERDLARLARVAAVDASVTTEGESRS